MLQRYFIKFSYLGTRFRGLQKQPGEIFNEETAYLASIQTVFEQGFLRLKPVNQPQITISSRTDQGVHALCNVAHVDLEKGTEGVIYTSEAIKKTLNHYMSKSDISLVVTHVEPVPDTFHSRFSSLSRQYLYRLAVTSSINYPITEWRKCYFVPEPFCPKKASEACKLFTGTKNFANFCHKLNRQPEGYPTVRTLDYFDIQPGRPLFDPVYDRLYDGVAFWDFHVKGRAFMYKQVRRMVSVVLAVAQSRIPLDEVHRLFEEPGYWNSKAATAPPYGLYLVNVECLLPTAEVPIVKEDNLNGQS